MTLRRALRRFHRDQRGTMTYWALFTLVSLLMVGGYAVDTQNVMQDRTRLQNTADAAAHAALLTRELGTIDAARAKAVEVSQMNMPASQYGNVLSQADVVFGTWNATTRSFTASSTSKSAVQVTVHQNSANNNSIGTYLFKLVGQDDWDLTLTSVYTTYNPTCFKEGFVAEGVVDIQSNNAFKNGFCIHSNDYVSLNSNNYFEPGTVVSMPDLADLDIPNSGFQTNVGLRAALREGSYNIRIVSRIDDIIDTIDNVGSAYRPSYITKTTTKTITAKTITAADLAANSINYWNCTGGKGTISKDAVIQNVVIISNCEITFASGVVVQDAVISTTSTAARSFYSSAGMQLGKKDSCASGGGAQLLTQGGMKFASKLQVYGSQLMAIGDIEFAAQGDGVEGVAMVAGGTISGTSNMTMAYCGKGMEQNFTASYFRLSM